MKKLVVFLILTIPFTAFSQTDKPLTKGNIILSGGVYSEFSKKRSVSTFFSLTPGIGYFFIDNLVLGINTNVTFGKDRIVSGFVTDDSYNSLGFGPFIKYYFKNGIFLKTETLYSFYHSSVSGPQIGSQQLKFREYTITPGFGYAFFINQKISLEPGVSYMYYNSITNDYRHQHGLTPKMNSIIFEIKFNLFL